MHFMSNVTGGTLPPFFAHVHIFEKETTPPSIHQVEFGLEKINNLSTLLRYYTKNNYNWAKTELNKLRKYNFFLRIFLLVCSVFLVQVYHAMNKYV